MGRGVGSRGVLKRRGVRYEEFSFFFNDTATTEIYTLSLHDALPISFVLFALLSLNVAMGRCSSCGSLAESSQTPWSSGFT